MLNTVISIIQRNKKILLLFLTDSPCAFKYLMVMLMLVVTSHHNVEHLAYVLKLFNFHVLLKLYIQHRMYCYRIFEKSTFLHVILA